MKSSKKHGISETITIKADGAHGPAGTTSREDPNMANQKQSLAIATQVESHLPKMTPDLQQVYAKMHDLFVMADAQEIDSRYQIGELVEAVRTDMKKYGKTAVETLAKALGLDDSTLYRYGAVVGCWGKREFEKVRNRRDAYNRPLSWSHFVVFCEVEDDRIRDELIEAVLADGLSVSKSKHKRNMLLHPAKKTAAVPATVAPPTAATAAAVKIESRQNTPESQCDEEDTRQAPNDAAQALEEMLELSDVVFDGFEAQQDRVLAAIANLPAGGDTTETMTVLLEQVVASLQVLREQCDKNIERLSAARIAMNAMPAPKRPASGGKPRKGAPKTSPAKMLAG